MFIFETRCCSLQESARPILIQPFPVRYRIQTSYNLDELHDMRGSHDMSTNECRLQELLHSSYYLLRQIIQNISWILQTLSFSDKREVPIESCNIVLKNLISNKKKSQAPNFTQYCPQELRLSQTRDKSPWKVVILSSRTLSISNKSKRQVPSFPQYCPQSTLCLSLPILNQEILQRNNLCNFSVAILIYFVVPDSNPIAVFYLLSYILHNRDAPIMSRFTKEKTVD